MGDEVVHVVVDGEMARLLVKLDPDLYTKYGTYDKKGHPRLYINHDNLCTMQLEKNGCESSGQRTRHINIWYYSITDRIAKKEATVQ